MIFLSFDKEFDIIYPEINKDIWGYNFKDYGFLFPKVIDTIKTGIANDFSLNIFDNFSLDLHQDNFNNINHLLIDEGYLSNEFCKYLKVN